MVSHLYNHSLIVTFNIHSFHMFNLKNLGEDEDEPMNPFWLLFLHLGSSTTAIENNLPVF